MLMNSLRVPSSRHPASHPGHQLLQLSLEPASFFEAEHPCVVLPRCSAGAQVHGFAAFIAEPCGAVLLNAGQRLVLSPLEDDVFSADVIDAPIEDILRTNCEQPDRQPFQMPWTRISSEQYFGLRLCLLQTNTHAPVDHALQDWARLVIGTTRAVWRKHAIPRAGLSSNIRECARFAMVQSVTEHMNRHWSRNVSLDELADRFELSSFHLVRAFRQVMGETPHQYLIHLRLRRSLDLIADERYRIVDIAESTGFCSHAHYTNAFRNVFGTTPKEFAGMTVRQAAADTGKRGLAASVRTAAYPSSQYGRSQAPQYAGAN